MQPRPDDERHDRLQRAVALIHAGALVLAEATRDEDRAGADDRLRPLLQKRAEERGERLTDAEADVLLRFASGDSTEDIATERSSSTVTVTNQLALALEKTGFGDRGAFSGWVRILGTNPYCG